MLAMTDWFQFVFNLMLYVAHPAHVIGVTALVFVFRGGNKDGLAKFLAPYALATLPLLVFYNFTRATIGDFSFQTYPRYWVSFEVVLAALGVAYFAHTKSMRELRPIIVLLVAGALFLGGLAIFDERGREDSAFAGGFTERYIPAAMTLATSEMNTFGFMIERPIADLWGYTTPDIAFSKVCNADRIRSNAAFFLKAAPDVYWPYWFTRSMSTDERGGFDNAETALANHHHTSHRGNLLGDLREVLKQYDIVVIDFPGRPKLDRIGYLVRREKVQALSTALREHGIEPTRERQVDWNKFETSYNQLALKQYRCN